MGIEYLLVRVKEDSDNEFKEYIGLELMAIRINEDKEPIIVRPIKLDQMEKFYKASYDSGMKDMISSDYEYCVWYLADEECELQCTIDIDQLDVIRELTKEDIEEHDKNFEEFKKIHKFDERKKKIEEEERLEKTALEEFKKESKVKFRASLKDGNFEIVDAIRYKGFAVHNRLYCNDDSIFKDISICEGENSGRKLTSCSVVRYKEMIDEIREALGDREIEESDAKKIREIISKY